MEYRTERDSLGTLEVPASAYYGIQTLRALQNFQISNLQYPSEFVRAIAWIKVAAARTNFELGYLQKKKAAAIEEAALSVSRGEFEKDIRVDVFQAGAGTSFHMNLNEVIANRACELLGKKKGSYGIIHPNDHVNMGQSTNDVIPTAIRLATLMLQEPFLKSLKELESSLQKKSLEFESILKSGRTHLQDAVPIRLGQEFGAYAKTVQKFGEEFSRATTGLNELGIGGSAVGTGLNTHPDYRTHMLKHLQDLSGFPLIPAENLFEAMQSMSPFTRVSASLRNLCTELGRIANDLRLMASGPNTGLAEISLPVVQPGSSIMPGKVNPVMAEMLNMVCFHIMASDYCVSLAAGAGQLELNVMMPIIAYHLLSSFPILINAIGAFREKGIEGITVNEEVCRRYADQTLALATILNPYIGYSKAAEVAKESQQTGRTIKEIVREKHLLKEEDFKKVFDPDHLTRPRKVQ